MENFENFLSVLDYSLSSTRKRHLTGGMLLSISLLFGGLAFTVMTLKTGEVISLKTEEEEEEEVEDYE